MSTGQLASGRAELEAQAAFPSLGLSTIQSAPAPEEGDRQIGCQDPGKERETSFGETKTPRKKWEEGGREIAR